MCTEIFTISGELKFLDEYFTEAFESNRREEAISIMERNESTGSALEELKEAMDESVSVGIVNGKDARDKEDLFEKTDAAMYRSKKSGKRTYTFND
ncbi:MAG: diguanylate cyclase [Lachnospiraceae bacterium]|nr:diguanylate cyclase [Lachnospiraceae bacterium]